MKYLIKLKSSGLQSLLESRNVTAMSLVDTLSHAIEVSSNRLEAQRSSVLDIAKLLSVVCKVPDDHL